MTEEDAKIYNWILDSFGEPIFQGDWIYFNTFRNSLIKVGKIVEFSKKGNPRVSYNIDENTFRLHRPKLTHSFSFVVQSSYIKCCNKTLIEELNNLCL